MRNLPTSIGRRASMAWRLHIALCFVAASGACTRESSKRQQPMHSTARKSAFAKPSRLVTVRPDSIAVMVISDDTIAAVRDSQRLGWIRALS